MRCFVAVDLAPAVRDAVVRAQAGLRAAARHADVRWVDPAALHLTLKFLGQVQHDAVAGLAAAVARAVAPTAPLALAAGGLGAFPNLRRPRVVWAGVTAGSAALVALAGVVERTVAPLGFTPEARPFHPHVTLGRVRSPRGAGPLGKAIEASTGLALGAWTAREAVLYRSHLRPTGAVYEVIAHLPFGGNDA